MQPAGGYGGVSEMQQLMMDVSCCPSSLFSISTPNSTTTTTTSAAAATSAEIPPDDRFPHHPFHQLHHHLQAPPPPPPHFAHFGQHFPITQQLFHHPHPFQLFNHHHIQQQQQQLHLDLGLDQESGPENSNSSARLLGAAGGAPSFLAAMNFKLAVDDSTGRSGENRLNDDDGILHGGDDGSESRLHPWRHTEDDSTTAIKQPFWRPLDIDYNINPNNKRPSKDKQPASLEISSNKQFKTSDSASITATAINNVSLAAPTTTNSSNYKLFSELEAIYKPGAGPTVKPNTTTTTVNNNNNLQTGSDSALTGGDEDDNNPFQIPATALGPTTEHDYVSDTSNGGEPPLSFQNIRTSKRSKRRRQQKQQLSSIAVFFESLLQRLMDHQESLHRKFLDAIEKRDQERTDREEAWRKQESAKADREAAARAHERAQSVVRESAIISFLEKISGESLNRQFGQQQNVTDLNDNSVEPYRGVQLGSSRWPKAEVQALIRVRSGLEGRFQEPGLKGPLWEEVSKGMARIGYSRSAKRCKEKWENINKYFRKTKDSGKKRPRQSKTCPYFHELDQLYSRSNINSPNVKDNNSQLLDAVVELKDNQRLEFSEVEPLRVELSSSINEANNDNEEEEDEEEEEEEGEGDSQDRDATQTVPSHLIDGARS